VHELSAFAIADKGSAKSCEPIASLTFVVPLPFIIRATPSEVGPDHPFCEQRMTSWGQHVRFPSKMAALTLLARMLGWNGPTKVEVAHDPDAGFKKLRECISTRS
jgi:hypothetical protein